ncbi:hypothetical protein JHK85_018284 [Glycine max]|nr:hypothetical protein JHK85_018284 [Glycine max]
MGLLYRNLNLSSQTVLGILNNWTKLALINLQLSNTDLQNLTLMEIEKILDANRKSLRNYPTMPYPNAYVTMSHGEEKKLKCLRLTQCSVPTVQCYNGLVIQHNSVYR